MTDETSAGAHFGGGRLSEPLPAKQHPDKETLIAFSHLRWDFVFQRPQHLLSRAARSYRVLFLEEPIFENSQTSPHLERTRLPSGVERVVPHLPSTMTEQERTAALRKAVTDLVGGKAAQSLIAWYYTPMALAFTQHIDFDVCIYDCMDELSAFKNAPQSLRREEDRLLSRSDLVFTGGLSLYEAKRDRHPSVHPYPSSVDRAHFEPARKHHHSEPGDLAAIPHPRVGYFGVIDERLDYALLEALADAKPDMHFVMIGPTAKVDPNELPRRPNIHWLGGKPYADLPAYLAGFDAGFMPFAICEATRFISPTKTPEFLAAGVPVVSTPIADVVRTYGPTDTIIIAADCPAMAEAIEAQLAIRASKKAYRAWLARADRSLAVMSWDATWSAMNRRLRTALSATKRQPLERSTTLLSADRHV